MLAPEANAFQRSREVWGYQGQRQDISRDKNYAKQKTFFCCDELPVRHMLIQLYLPLATMTVCVI